jgi:hypothetical protein
MVRSPLKIAKKYLKSWFIADFIACMPLENILDLMK